MAAASGGAVRRQKFFKVLLPGSPFTSTLSLPPEFVARMDIPPGFAIATLRDPAGRSWQVDLDRDRRCFVGKGWRSFLAGTGASAGHLLVFEHLGGLSFAVEPFDASGCSLDARVDTTASRSLRDDHDHDAEVESRSDNRWSPTAPYTPVNQSRNPSPATASAAGSCQRSSSKRGDESTLLQCIIERPFYLQYLNLTKALCDGLGWTASRTAELSVAAGSGERRWEVRVKVGDKGGMIMAGWAGFAQDNGLRVTDVCIFRPLLLADTGDQLVQVQRKMNYDGTPQFGILVYCTEPVNTTGQCGSQEALPITCNTVDGVDAGAHCAPAQIVRSLIENILLRLPSKDVGRCRAVSTSWHNVISTPEFMLRHHHRQPSLPIIGGREMLAAFGAGPLWPFLPGDKHGHGIRLRGACDGLLAVSWGSRYYVCNPVIRTRALLPEPQPQPRQDVTMGFAGKHVHRNVIISFYRHHPTGVHRVLWVSLQGFVSFERALQGFQEYSLYILTVGGDTPRHVEVRLLETTPEPDNMKYKMLLAMLYSSNHFPVVDHGNLHWNPYCGRCKTSVDGQTIVFDTEAESFRWMRCPAQQTYNMKLFSVKGSLAFVGCSCGTYTAVDVWVMQDYEAEIWDFKYRVDLLVVETSRQLHLTSSVKESEKRPRLDLAGKWIHDMIAFNERELLIMCNPKHVLHCDIDGKFLGMVNVGNNRQGMVLTQFRLQESIIPIQYDGMQEEDEEQPLSVEHV